ncbi:PIG-L family deacetylase [Pseudothauera nasutitermitis]|uniref:PIG-L family deacetylase n=1 Tax=Pseudothauera nasutitermitis TaxID=2565930 RepID=A0A4S4AWY4_9RHOO|nr:PIG-L deacetylase family protein [Pseudothauera nasutitermitis]THF63118.1 PIG-L family deacetylase [Pseudothauera nasutitermitis]
MKTVLIVSAHPDDEALGCGGTIARHVSEGDIVYAVFLADGVSARETSGNVELEQRTGAAEKARQLLGIRESYYLGLPDNRLDYLPLIEVVQCLEPIVRKVRPDVIYTHHHGDLNIDHRITHAAVLTACRPMPGCSVREIYAFEVMSSTEWATPSESPFQPNHYVDISDFLDVKLQALQAYELEMRDEPHSRSLKHLESLARHRGNTVGVVAAEAFMVVRLLR